ncbi:MAG: transporter substrate-binding domain-containing protein [Verrucomicrobia bacterium]|nr:transporter substrate-binding domain-containing protein [Verrucomicrobiota bacterium]
MKDTTQKVLWAVLLVAVGCGPPQTQLEREPVRFGLALEAPAALSIIALQKDYFAAEGLEMSVVPYASGARAFSAMLTGAVDVATTAEVPVVAESFQRQDFRVFASVASVGNLHWVVARKDAGIEKGSDLRGKRVATQRASSVHFFLHLFLLHNGMVDGAVALSFQKIEDLVPALVNGEVDAISTREPYVTEAADRLGEKVVVLGAPGVYVRSQHLAASAAWLQQHPGAARRLVRGLLRAEEFVRRAPADARQIVARRVGMPLARLSAEWGQVYFRVGLEQSLLPQFEEEAKWMLDQKLVTARPLPNYLRLLDTTVLDAVKPEAVTIVR